MLHQFKTGGPFWRYLLGVTTPSTASTGTVLATSILTKERVGDATSEKSSDVEKNEAGEKFSTLYKNQLS